MAKSLLSFCCGLAVVKARSSALAMPGRHIPEPSSLLGEGERLSLQSLKARLAAPVIPN